MKRGIVSAIIAGATLFGVAERVSATDGHRPATADCSRVSNDFSITATYHWTSNGIELGNTKVPAAPSSDKPVFVSSNVPAGTTGWFATWGDGFRVPAGNEFISIDCGGTSTTVALTTTVAVTTTTADGTPTDEEITTTTSPNTTFSDRPSFPTSNGPRFEEITTTSWSISGSLSPAAVTLPSTGASQGTDLRLPIVFLMVGVALVLIGRRRACRF